MKEKCIAGLIFLIPLAITYWFLSSIISLLISPFQDITASFLHWLDIFTNGFLFFSHEQLISCVSVIAALMTLIVFSVGTGYISEKYISHPLRTCLDDMLMQIPLLNKVYSLSKRVTAGLFVEKRSITTSVALNSFMSPSQHMLSIVTNKIRIQKEGQTPVEYLITFLPSTPNPTGAYLVFTPVETAKSLVDLSVDEACRFVISCGTAPVTFRA